MLLLLFTASYCCCSYGLTIHHCYPNTNSFKTPSTFSSASSMRSEAFARNCWKNCAPVCSAFTHSSRPRSTIRRLRPPREKVKLFQARLVMRLSLEPTVQDIVMTVVTIKRRSRSAARPSRSSSSRCATSCGSAPRRSCSRAVLGVVPRLPAARRTHRRNWTRETEVTTRQFVEIGRILGKWFFGIETTKLTDLQYCLEYH